MNLTVDPPELHTASTKLGTYATNYENLYKQLMNTASTMGQAWSAADNIAFVEQITGFCDELQAMTDHLRNASQALDLQAQNYEDTRQNNITNVRQLAN